MLPTRAEDDFLQIYKKNIILESRQAHFNVDGFAKSGV